MTQLTLDQAFQSAIALQRNGHADQACAIYQQLLQHLPDNGQILHMYGVAEIARGHFDAGYQHLRHALKVSPDQPELLLSLGNGLLVQGRPAEALPYLKKAARLQPDFSDAHENCAIAEMRLDRTAEAAESYRRVTECHPRHARAHFQRGTLLCQLGRHAEAVECFNRALAIAPNLPGLHTNRGNALAELDRPGEALADYRIAVRNEPQSPEAHYNYAHTLHDLGDFNAALPEYDTALTLQPKDAKVLACRGSLMVELKRPEEALTDFDAALALAPDYPEVWYGRGRALIALGQKENAFVCFNQALTLNPEFAEAYDSRGTWYYDCAEFDKAGADYDAALKRKPGQTNALVNKAYLCLLTGRIAEGRVLYENRWQQKAYKAQMDRFSQAPWRGGTAIAGKRVFIWQEQGIGDFIQCARFAALAAARGAKVYLETPAPLTDLMDTLKGDITLVAEKSQPPAFDLHIPTMSLPLAFAADEALLAKTVPYLARNPARITKWHTLLGEKKRLRIGICWAGNPTYKNDAHRSIAAERLKPLFALPFDFHLLQPGVRADDASFVAGVANLYLHTDSITDYADTAALMGEMDQIISVDTSVAHLAGALGLPLWILLPFVPDSRWLLAREDTPLYPTARLFRQRSIADWDEVLKRVSAALTARERKWAK